jgi:hypothetical protein
MTNGADRGDGAPGEGEQDLIDALRELRRLERVRHAPSDPEGSAPQLDGEIERARRRAWGLADALGRAAGGAAQGGAPGRRRSPTQDDPQTDAREEGG